jgi:hypothetical protein
MSFFSVLKYAFIIFAAHLAISCGPPFGNHCDRVTIDRFWIDDDDE